MASGGLPWVVSTGWLKKLGFFQSCNCSIVRSMNNTVSVYENNNSVEELHRGITTNVDYYFKKANFPQVLNKKRLKTSE